MMAFRIRILYAKYRMQVQALGLAIVARVIVELNSKHWMSLRSYAGHNPQLPLAGLMLISMVIALAVAIFALGLVGPTWRLALRELWFIQGSLLLCFGDMLIRHPQGWLAALGIYSSMNICFYL